MRCAKCSGSGETTSGTCMSCLGTGLIGLSVSQNSATIARLEAENRDLRAKLETVEAETRERLSNMLDPEIGFPSDDLLRCIHADVEMRGRKNEAFAVTVHHRNIMLSAVAAAIRNLDPRHD